MNTHYNSPNNRQGQDTTFDTQSTLVYRAFKEYPKTMLMVSIETGILRANICRYVARWRKSNRIESVKTDYCKITKHPAGYLSTNPDLFPKSNQLKLF